MYGRGQSNLAHDFNAYDSTGKIWHIGSSTFVTEAVADYVSYRIPAVKGSDANDAAVQAPFSATAPTGTVRYVLRERGASLALSYEVWEGDLTTTLIQTKTDLLGTGTVILSAPVSGDGELLELILDTDYLAANGRALEWTFDQIPNITTAATGKFGLKNSENGTEVYVNSSGTVTDLGDGTFKVSFDITNTALAGLSPEEYDWSVEVLEGSYKITIARNRQRKTRVNIVEKQT